MTEDKLTIDEKITIKELEDKIKSMKEDKEKKCKAAKEQLIDMLEVTADKYRTATGTAEALRVVRFVYGDKIDGGTIANANNLAHLMAQTAFDMIDKAKSLNYVEMDQLCDGFYEKDLELEPIREGIYGDYPMQESEMINARDLAYEMMRIDLCRNVGGAAEDMVEFIKRVQEEIDATGEELKKLKAGKKD